MANPEHVAVVRKGAQAISEWRRAHPSVRLDLSGAELIGIDLSFAFVADEVILANLSGAHLAGAQLVGADFTAADLSGADLSECNLADADLSMANLRNANFREAMLVWARLSMNQLSGADLSEAQLGGTSLIDVDLSHVTGLASVKHEYPSAIDVRTLFASVRGAGAALPELMTFLRGAGMPQELLDGLPAILAKGGHYSCFISYGQPDLVFATKLYEDLKSKRVRCWVYEMDKTPGKRIRGEIGDERRGTDKFVILCSAAALIRDGVLDEVEDQINEDPNKLVPVSLDNLWKEPGLKVVRGNNDLKPFLLNRNYADFAGWESDPKRYDKGLEELLRGLKQEKPPE